VDVLRRYSGATLSFESEKLVALSGVVRYLSEKSLGKYFAGLWRNNLKLQLLHIMSFKDAKGPFLKLSIGLTGLLLQKSKLRPDSFKSIGRF
jgi:hypothetical protein